MRFPDRLWKRESGRLERLVLSPLLAASWLYAAVAWLNRARHSPRLCGARRLDCCVVSVGSPVVGGAAKTPTAAWIASGLAARGHRVAIATRGYGGRRARGPIVVSDGVDVQCDVAHAGDEALVLCSHAKGVPVVVARDRAAAGALAIERFGTRVLVLDDGLAHHRLARDVEIVTLDAWHGLGNGCVLPRGPLREPLAALGHFDAFGVVDGPLSPVDRRRLASRTSGALHYTAVRRPVTVHPLAGGPMRDPSCLRGAEIGALSGIAQPDGFVRSLESLGARVVARREFGDHHAYRRRDLEGLDREARLWLTTEKDAVKLSPAWLHAVDVQVLRIELDVAHGDELLDWLEGKIASAT
jgi:tetraacyldisaccharide 4'-kinase